ncbi:hypothetical protein U1Q18_008034 [Sarracenia purpurea var. burkii]
MAFLRISIVSLTTLWTLLCLAQSSSDTNPVYSPCSDTTVQRSDGFTFAIVFAARTSFFFNSSVQLSPCDKRLSLSSSNSQFAIFRPKVDEISLLTINTTSFSPVAFGCGDTGSSRGVMVEPDDIRESEDDGKIGASKVADGDSSERSAGGLAMGEDATGNLGKD